MVEKLREENSTCTCISNLKFYTCHGRTILFICQSLICPDLSKKCSMVIFFLKKKIHFISSETSFSSNAIWAKFQVPIKRRFMGLLIKYLNKKICLCTRSYKPVSSRNASFLLISSSVTS